MSSFSLRSIFGIRFNLIDVTLCGEEEDTGLSLEFPETSAVHVATFGSSVRGSHGFELGVHVRPLLPAAQDSGSGSGTGGGAQLAGHSANGLGPSSQ